MSEATTERGSVLLAVLAILSILAVTITGVLIFGGWQKKQGILYLEGVRVRSLAESGVHQAMVELAENPRTRCRDQRVIFDSANQISYSIRPWGAYLQVKSTGVGRRLSRTLTAILGVRPPAIFDHVLTPIGSPYPLVVSGRSHIRGNIFVGPAGVTRGEINGRGYLGEQLVEGNIDTLSAARLPRFDGANLLEFLDSLVEFRQNASVTDLSLTIQGTHDLAVMSEVASSAISTRADIEFNILDSNMVETEQYFFADRKIQVLGTSHLRNLVLSAEEIVVAHEARLVNCIIVADRVRLTDGSTFSGQAIVTDTMIVESEATLEQPSLIFLRGRSFDERIVGEIELSSQGKLQATVVCGRLSRVISNESVPEFACRLKVLKHSQLRGLVWWEGLVEIEGAFAGAAAVNLFSHYVQPTTYMNWLVDADIRFFDAAANTAFPIVFANQHQPKLCVMVESRVL